MRRFRNPIQRAVVNDDSRERKGHFYRPFIVRPPIVRIRNSDTRIRAYYRTVAHDQKTELYKSTTGRRSRQQTSNSRAPNCRIVAPFVSAVSPSLPPALSLPPYPIFYHRVSSGRRDADKFPIRTLHEHRSSFPVTGGRDEIDRRRERNARGDPVIRYENIRP